MYDEKVFRFHLVSLLDLLEVGGMTLLSRLFCYFVKISVSDVYSFFGEEESSVLLVFSLIFRLLYASKLLDSGFFLRSSVGCYAESCIELIKRWLRDASFDFVPGTVGNCYSQSFVEELTSKLYRFGVLSPFYCRDVAELIFDGVVEGKNIHFIGCSMEASMVLQLLRSGNEMGLKKCFFVDGVFLPISLSVVSQLALQSGCSTGGILVFSCSLEVRCLEAQRFLNIIRKLGIVFVGSQRVICDEMKELLFDMGVVTIERLSLRFCRVVGDVTGAIPFHSEREFYMWAENFGLGCGGPCKVGSIRKAELVKGGGLWIYGKDNVRTIVVPNENPFAECAILEACECTTQYARALFIDSSVFSGNYFSLCEIFLSEYISCRLTRYKTRNVYLSCFVKVLCSALEFHAEYLSPSLVSRSVVYAEEIRRVSRSCAERRNAAVTTLAPVSVTEGGSLASDRDIAFLEVLQRCVGALEVALNGASVLLRVTLKTS